MDQESGRRRRRRYSPEFKAELVATCLQPGVSVASIALANGMNANVLHGWLAQHRHSLSSIADAKSTKSLTDTQGTAAFVPIALDDPRPPAADIRIELRRAATTVNVTWPVAAASECAAWMRELLR